jgi:protein gp37
MSTGIEWTDETWNPVVGCEYVSEGCRGCYAARDAFGRLKGLPIYAGLAVRHLPSGLPRFTGEVRTIRERLEQPIRWKRSRRVFVNSMSDLFHPQVPDHYIAEVFGVMAVARQHQFQVLTKRPQRMAQLTSSQAFRDEVTEHAEDRERSIYRDAVEVWPLPNVWLGTSIESPKYLWRGRHLIATDAAVRFLSVEPLIEDLVTDHAVEVAELIAKVDWVIVGGESGPQARPMHPTWASAIRDICVQHATPFLFKQWGEWAPGRTGQPVSAGAAAPADVVLMDRVGKKVAGRVLDGRTWDEYPAEREAV